MLQKVMEIWVIDPLKYSETDPLNLSEAEISELILKVVRVLPRLLHWTNVIQTTTPRAINTKQASEPVYNDLIESLLLFSDFREPDLNQETREAKKYYLIGYNPVYCLMNYLQMCKHSLCKRLLLTYWRKLEYLLR